MRLSRKLFRKTPFLHKFHPLNSVYRRRNFSAVTYEDCYWNASLQSASPTIYNISFYEIFELTRRVPVDLHNSANCGWSDTLALLPDAYNPYWQEDLGLLNLRSYSATSVWRGFVSNILCVQNTQNFAQLISLIPYDYNRCSHLPSGLPRYCISNINVSI